MVTDFSTFGKVEKPMLGIIVVVLLVLATYNWQVAILCAILAGAVLAYIGHRAKKRRDDLTEYLEVMSSNVGKTTHYALQNLPMAIAIVDYNMTICWANSVFKDWLGGDWDKTQNLKAIRSTLRIEKLWGKTGHYTETIEDRTFMVYYKFIEAPECRGK